ncbi:MAG: hypothetical protein V4621_06715 [Pseudomonadota bacterium]
MRNKTLTSLMLATLMLAGCTIDNTAALRPAPQMTLEQFTPLTLPVRTVDVIPTQGMNTNAGYGVLPMPVDQAIEGYARKRFIAGGGAPTMTVTVVESRFKQSPMRDVTGAGLGILTMQRMQTIEIGARVKVEIMDGTRQQTRQEYNLSSKTELSDQLSLADRDLKLIRFMEGFLIKLDTQILEGVQKAVPSMTLTKIQPTPSGEM